MSNAMCGKDPLLRFITDKLRTPLRAAVWAILIHGIAHFGAGLWVNYVTHGSTEITGILSPYGFWFGLFLWFFEVPTWWAYFVWQPSAILRTINSLETNAVICCAGEIQNTTSTTPKSAIKNSDLSSRVSSALNTPLWSIMAFLATVVVILLYAVFIVPQESALLGGKPSFWFADPRTHFLLLALVSLNSYLFIGFILRTFVIIIEFRAFFRNRNSITAIHPLHPDGCGGFGALGGFAARVGLLAIIMGFWAAAFTLSPILAGGYPRLSFVMVMLYVTYIVVTPLCLITPIWSAHKAMQRFRDSTLSAISYELEELVTSSMSRLGTMRRAPSVKTLQANIDKMEYLRQMYQFVLSTTPIWPISFPTIKRFGITATLPLVSGLLPLAIDVVRQLISR